MRFSAPLLALAGTVAGTAAAVVAYQATAAAPVTRPASSTTEDPAPAATTTWLPCDRGFKVEGTACVRVRHKVVVVKDLPSQAAAPAQTAGVRSAGHDVADDGDQNETEHADDSGDENEVEHADDSGDDHGSDDQASDDQSGHEDVSDD